MKAPVDAYRRSRIATTAGVAALLIFLAGVGYVAYWFFDMPPTVASSVVLPAPSGARVVYDGLAGCGAAGDQGFLFRDIVLTGSGADEDDSFGRHLRRRGFTLADEGFLAEWPTFVATKDGVRAYVGDLRKYLSDHRSNTPPVDHEEFDGAVTRVRGAAIIVRLEPSASCEV